MAVFFLGLGFLVVWLSRQFLGPVGDLPFVSLLLIPIIVYLVVSGRVKELRAGEVTAAFKDIAERSVDIVSRPITDAAVDDMRFVANIVKKRGLGELRTRIPGLDESKPIILTLPLGKAGYLDRETLQRYMQLLSQFPSFKFVVIQDRSGELVAYVTARTMQTILASERLGEELVRTINEGNTQQLMRYPGILSRTTTTKTSNIDALKEMVAQDLDALVVTENHKVKGVIEREQIISRLILAMAQ